MRGVAEVSATLVFFLYASSDLSVRKTESPPSPTGEGLVKIAAFGFAQKPRWSTD
jgi:hypothetical protein